MNRFLRLTFLKAIFAAGLFLVAFAAHAVDTETAIFDPDFRTLTVAVDGDRLAPPVLYLGGDDRLVIGFDELTDDRSYLRYTIVHCDADWQPSALVDSEVFDGFNFAEIDDYAFSRGTTTHYVHYTIVLPNENYRFNLSGNYLLKVYREDDPDRTLLQVRFMVSEDAIGVGGRATSRTDVDYNESHQQLELTVDTRNCKIRDPFNDLIIKIRQNYRPDTERTLSHPARTMGQRLFFEHTPELIFPAGNEYRRIETVSTQFPGMGVDMVEYNAPFYHHFVRKDLPRYERPYSFDSTQHGRYFVREYNSDDSDTEADYTVVHFTLDQPKIEGADIYLEGDFVQRHFDDNSMMRYDSSEGNYERTMLLKQGAYNYQYVAKPKGRDPNSTDGMKNASLSARYPIEGDKYETVNEYPVAVYYRVPGERYDRLLGYSVIFSGR